jgi:phosphotriesterase-related protein
MNDNGKVITAGGPVEPDALGRVLMHEHLHFDPYDWLKGEAIVAERPITEGRRAYLMEEAAPFLRRCAEHGCRGFLEATPPPWRAWPTFYSEVTRATGVHVVLCTGFYREVEVGTYWVHRPEDSIWPFVRESSAEELAGFCIGEILEGIDGTGVRAGAIKLSASGAVLTPTEEKAFRAGARAQKATGVHVTTHCTAFGAETSQLRLLEEEGVDLSRVAIGHTAWHLMDPAMRKTCITWMRRGASFLPTSMGIGRAEEWRPLVEAIHEVFDAGLGGCIAGFGLDWLFGSESGVFGACKHMPPPPFLHLLTHTLPAFRQMGMTAQEEEAIMAANPQRILAVRT